MLKKKKSTLKSSSAIRAKGREEKAGQSHHRGKPLWVTTWLKAMEVCQHTEASLGQPGKKVHWTPNSTSSTDRTPHYPFPAPRNQGDTKPATPLK